MLKKLGLIIVGALLFSGQAIAARAANIMMEETVSLTRSDGKPLNDAAVSKAIQAGAGVHGWQATPEGAGKIKLFLDYKGKHSVTLRATVSGSGYVLSYVDSSNLDYRSDGTSHTIHSSYVRWVGNLKTAIRQMAATTTD